MSVITMPLLLSVTEYLFLFTFELDPLITILAVIPNTYNIMLFYDKTDHYYCAHLQPQLNLEAVLSWL